MDLFRKKDIGALRSMAQNSGLTRNLSAFDLVFWVSVVLLVQGFSY